MDTEKTSRHLNGQEGKTGLGNDHTQFRCAIEV